MPDRFFTLHRHTARSALTALVLAVAFAPDLSAQTDYFNTDRGRPVRIEDAYTTERYAMELKLAPVRLEHAGGGVYNWGVDPEIAYGVLPRTHVELGLPMAYREAGGLRQSGIAGLELAAMHSFNAETETWPALALRGDVLLPVGSLAPPRAYPSLSGIGTRTFTWGRVHLNGTVTAGSTIDAAGADAETGADELSRWLVGGAVDRTFPLRATLITAELYARKPMIGGARVEYTTGIGARHQTSPTLALDAGMGRRLNGDAAGWYVTFGSAYAFGVASLFPTPR